MNLSTRSAFFCCCGGWLLVAVAPGSLIGRCEATAAPLTVSSGPGDFAAIGSIHPVPSDGPLSNLTLGFDQVTPLTLAPGTPGRSIDIVLRNDGAPLPIGGLDLKIAIEGAASPSPALAGMDLRPGSLFTTGNSVQGADPGNTPRLQFWSVSINDPFTPPTLLGGGVVTKVGSVSLSALGVTDGSWTLRFNFPETAVYDPFGDVLGLNLGTATLLIAVPEPENALSIAALLLLVWAGKARLCRRTAPPRRDPAHVSR